MLFRPAGCAAPMSPQPASIGCGGPNLRFRCRRTARWRSSPLSLIRKQGLISDRAFRRPVASCPWPHGRATRPRPRGLRWPIRGWRGSPADRWPV